jgi:hypothetical protein
LSACQEIENSLGRLREERWGPRTIDIDLLLYDELVLNEPDLQIPHPRMAWRRFVLEPAAEIAAEMLHPIIRRTVGRLLEHINTTPWYLAIAGPLRSEENSLAAELSRQLGARLLTSRLDPARREAFFANPPSCDWQIKLEFLEQRARLLDREKPDWALANLPAVSDFWFDQWTIFPSEGSFEQRVRYTDRWRELSSQVVRPRLLAMFHPPAEILLKPRSLPEGNTLKCIIEDLQQRTAQAAGPVLWLDAAAREAAVLELTAAVQAMR